MPLIKIERYTLNNALKWLKFTTKMYENGREINRKIIMSDGAHFHLWGYVNKWNRSIQCSENPTMIIEKPLYPLSILNIISKI